MATPSSAAMAGTPNRWREKVERFERGEPFINGQALPYDPKYYECWIANLRPPPIRMKKSKNLEERSKDVQNSEVQGVASNMGEAVAPSDMAGLSTVGGVPRN
ncbi:hypothetical protein Vadar_005270 [Vaccinium darrowii]|uniref:Uncharacterized protein n=1 Tax=Vaccinium darrowii TaxID=229202 RepID=A0ACB7XFF2_9ERIC|nr:hypothetical protein Vadar_005270 [Vaccinium darrowii]